ncbi:myosin tail region-interacting protein MTI1-like [Lingula anatina]|uniref:Myosin tail region-interacting protein MTI1-like n=1 Tax=Lingula anatina TaxID=7574 RepID=A0A1S3K0M2_LINAN|nr:myosin tail region-interacting protein MTI1-like [Lingula anatina]|eukprot:XP_013415831.1 myosin tail region-interacting protein MTI1-like [Lingula anatina]
MGFVWDPDQSGESGFSYFGFEQPEDIPKRQSSPSLTSETDENSQNSGNLAQSAQDAPESRQADDSLGLDEHSNEQQSTESPQTPKSETENPDDNRSEGADSTQHRKSSDSPRATENVPSMSVPTLFQASLRASLAAGILVENPPQNEFSENAGSSQKAAGATYIMAGINPDFGFTEQPTASKCEATHVMTSIAQKSDISEQQITSVSETTNAMSNHMNTHNSIQQQQPQQFSDLHQHVLRPTPLSAIDENNNEMPSASTAEEAWNILSNLGHLIQSNHTGFPAYTSSCNQSVNGEYSLPATNFYSSTTSTMTSRLKPCIQSQPLTGTPGDTTLKAFQPPVLKPSPVQSMYAPVPSSTKYVGTPRPVELTSKGPKPLKVPQMMAGPYSYVHVPYRLQYSASSMPPPPPPPPPPPSRPLQPIQPTKSDIYQNVRQALKFADQMHSDLGSESQSTSSVTPMHSTMVDKNGSIRNNIGASPDFPVVPPNTPTSDFKLRYQNILPGPMDQEFYTWSNERDSRGDHNAKERKRRARISEACHALRQLVPGLSDKTDKATVFEFAAQYIIHLREVIGSEYDKDFLRKYSPY